MRFRLLGLELRNVWSLAPGGVTEMQELNYSRHKAVPVPTCPRLSTKRGRTALVNLVRRTLSAVVTVPANEKWGVCSITSARGTLSTGSYLS